MLKNNELRYKRLERKTSKNFVIRGIDVFVLFSQNMAIFLDSGSNVKENLHVRIGIGSERPPPASGLF